MKNELPSHQAAEISIQYCATGQKLPCVIALTVNAGYDVIFSALYNPSSLHFLDTIPAEVRKTLVY